MKVTAAYRRDAMRFLALESDPVLIKVEKGRENQESSEEGNYKKIKEIIRRTPRSREHGWDDSRML